MDTGSLGVMAGIIISTSLFAMIFGIVYLHKRQKLAMIERGMNPRSSRPNSPPYITLTWALLIIGAGIGLFLAYTLDHTLFNKMNEMYDSGNVAIYFALIAIFGGGGLFLSYRIEKKEVEAHSEKNKQE